MTDTSVESGLPNVGHDENGNATLEWWRGERKITMYPMDGMLLKVWGPNCTSEMDEVRLEDYAAVRAAFQWLHQALPASSPAACSAADSRSLDAVADTARLDWLMESIEQYPEEITRFCYANNADYRAKFRAAIDAAMSHHSEERS